jgi:hypothetical protein
MDDVFDDHEVIEIHGKGVTKYALKPKVQKNNVAFEFGWKNNAVRYACQITILCVFVNNPYSS